MVRQRKPQSFKEWTVDELLALVIEREQGKSYESLSRKFGRTASSLTTTYSNFNCYRKGNLKRKFTQGTLTVFAEVLRQYLGTETREQLPVESDEMQMRSTEDIARSVEQYHEQEHSATVSSAEEKVFKAMDMLLDAVIEMAGKNMQQQKEDAQKQVAQTYEKQIMELRNKHAKDLQHYQELLAIAQDSSMVGLVKRKLGLTNGHA